MIYRRGLKRIVILKARQIGLKDGLVVVETTWRGGRGGHLWDIALETPEEQKHADDWRVVFFQWQDDPAYCDAEPQPLKEETVRYFFDKPGFSNGQKSWYQKARDQFGLFTLREFPTVLEECFQTPVEGAIYAELIDRLRAQGAIQRGIVFELDGVREFLRRALPVNGTCVHRSSRRHARRAPHRRSIRHRAHVRNRQQDLRKSLLALPSIPRQKVRS